MPAEATLAVLSHKMRKNTTEGQETHRTIPTDKLPPLTTRNSDLQSDPTLTKGLDEDGTFAHKKPRSLYGEFTFQDSESSFLEPLTFDSRPGFRPMWNV